MGIARLIATGSIVTTMALFSTGCGGGGGDSGSSSTATPTTTPSTPTTPTVTCPDTHYNDVQRYLFAHQPLFQVSDSDYTNGNGTYGCYNSGGTYAVTNASGSDNYNHSMTYTLTNCISKVAQSSYAPYTPYALTGSYTVTKTGSATNYTTTITPTSDIQMSILSTTGSLTPSSYSLLSGGSVAVTMLADQNKSNSVYTSWKIKSAIETLTGNYQTSASPTSAQAYTQTIPSGATITSSGGWNATFQTTTPLSRTSSVWPNTINSGVLSVSSNGGTATVTYSSEGNTTNYVETQTVGSGTSGCTSSSIDTLLMR